MSAKVFAFAAVSKLYDVVDPPVACTVRVLFDGLASPFGNCSCVPGLPDSENSTTYVALSFVSKDCSIPPFPKPFRSRLLVPFAACQGQSAT